jgi:hypothetical protein
MEKHDLAHIEAGVKEVSQILATLAHEKEFQGFLSIIHRPGWTTVAEAALVAGIVDSMRAHAKALADLKHALFTGAEAVALNPQPLPPRR